MGLVSKMIYEVVSEHGSRTSDTHILQFSDDVECHTGGDEKWAHGSRDLMFGRMSHPQSQWFTICWRIIMSDARGSAICEVRIMPCKDLGGWLFVIFFSR